MNCKEFDCSVQILPSKRYCLKHGSAGRFLKEKIIARKRTILEKKKQRERFTADGKVRPGQGLSRDKAKRKQNFHHRLVMIIGFFFKEISLLPSEKKEAA